MTAEPFQKKCSVPRDALAYRALRRVDYADAYSIKIEARGPEVLDLYARVYYGRMAMESIETAAGRRLG